MQSSSFFHRFRRDPVELYPLCTRHVQHAAHWHQTLWRQQARGVSSNKLGQGITHQRTFLTFFSCKTLLHKQVHTLCRKTPTLLNALGGLSNSQLLVRCSCLDHVEDSELCFNLGRHAITKLTQAKCFFDISSGL